MPTRIKNCGLKTPEAIEKAVATGASFVGFVHHEKSPRHVDATTISQLFKSVPTNVSRVIVLVNPDDATLNALPKPDYWQIHGATADRIADIYERTRVPIIAAISVRDANDLANIATLEEISTYLLFDAQVPGSGKPFDWRLLKNLPLKKKWFLAGGLTPENVAEAIKITGAPMVDVSSGIEEPMGSGTKSLEKIAAFNTAVIQPHA